MSLWRKWMWFLLLEPRLLPSIELELKMQHDLLCCVSLHSVFLSARTENGRLMHCDTERSWFVMSLLSTGLQWVHDPRDEPAEGAVSHPARVSARDRAHGEHHPPQVQLHPDAAQAEHLRGRHDPALALSGRQVRSPPPYRSFAVVCMAPFGKNM